MFKVFETAQHPYLRPAELHCVYEAAISPPTQC